MLPETKEWVEKAEADCATMQREAAVVENPNFDAVCFHAQQCVEKYLKARLIDASMDFPKTHNLATLLSLLKPKEPSWEPMRSALARLTTMGVEVRYPGFKAEQFEAEEAVAIAIQVRQIVREALGIHQEEL